MGNPATASGLKSKIVAPHGRLGTNGVVYKKDTKQQLIHPKGLDPSRFRVSASGKPNLHAGTMSVVGNCRQLRVVCIKSQRHYMSFEEPDEHVHVCSLQGAGKQMNTGKNLRLSTVSWETRESLPHRLKPLKPCTEAPEIVSLSI